jgi:hypothetical protein
LWFDGLFQRMLNNSPDAAQCFANYLQLAKDLRAMLAGPNVRERALLDTCFSADVDARPARQFVNFWVQFSDLQLK